MPNNIKFLLVICSLIFCFSSAAQTMDNILEFNDRVSEEHNDDSFRVIFNGTFLSVNNKETNQDIAGLGGAFQVLYTYSKKFGFGGGAGTSMNETGAGAATILNWAFTYALTGSLMSTKSSYSYNGKQVLKADNSIAQGFRVQALLSQYYFNATKNTVPYAGIGGLFYYDKFFDFLGSNAILGIRFDYLFNNETPLMPLTLVFGIII